MAERQRQEEQEQLELTVTPLPTEEPEESVTPVPDIFGQQEEESARQSNKKYKFLDFAENLGDLFTKKQIKKIKKTTKNISIIPEPMQRQIPLSVPDFITEARPETRFTDI